MQTVINFLFLTTDWKDASTMKTLTTLWRASKGLNNRGRTMAPQTCSNRVRFTTIFHTEGQRLNDWRDSCRRNLSHYGRQVLKVCRSSGHPCSCQWCASTKRITFQVPGRLAAILTKAQSFSERDQLSSIVTRPYLRGRRSPSHRLNVHS